MDKPHSTLFQIRQERLEKVEKLKQLGIEPYPAKAEKDEKNQVVVDNYDKFEGKELMLAGRLMSFREHGALAFGHIQDQSGQIQLYIRKDELAATSKENQTIGFENLNLLDVGDFVQAKGTVTKTQRGEISLLVKELKLLTKSIRPLPEKREGIKDKEERFRRRYLDIVMNPEIKERFLRKAKFWEVNRDFMHQRGFVEVETPVLEHITGGADANPFITHHNDLDQDFYMRISTELYQKRLIGAGFEKVYTLGPNFRNEGISDEHLQEYYQIEWYWAYADYKDNMEMVKEMFRYIAKEVYGKTKFTTRGHSFDLADEWEEIDYAKTIKEKLDVDIFNDSEEKMLKIIKENEVTLSGDLNRNRLIDNLWKIIRKTISGPAFLVNEPKFMSPLAKSKPENQELTERFHIVLAGSELGNGYSEINDPVDQYKRFVEQQNLRNAGDDEAQMMDIDFVEMLEYGMPPTSGYAHSERLFWFLEDVVAREGVLFPQMRFEVSKTTREIYPEYAKLLGEIKDEPTQAGSGPSTDIPTSGNLPTREEALKLLKEYVEDDYQRLHAKMVASALENLAGKYEGEGPELWYITGLLHDLDFDKYPEEHPKKSLEWFKEWGYPEELIHAVAAHAYDRTDTEPKTTLANALLATDEFSGLLYAYSKMKGGKFDDMKVKSIKKKFKDKSFAAKINRDDIQMGIDGLGIDFEELAESLVETFNAMKEFE